MLNEIKWRDFFADCATYVMSEDKYFKIQGNREMTEATAHVLSKSRKLYELLCLEETSILDVKEAVVDKKRASKRFFDATGIHWPF
jgi:hypothetical protein